MEQSRAQLAAIAVLKENETIHYPKLIVRPQFAMDLAAWSSVNADDFVLEWQSLAGGHQDVDHYELEMMLTAPAQMPRVAGVQRVIQSSTETVRETRWEVGTKGVGGKRLRPGNIYMFEVRAISRDGKTLARLPRTPVWVPWTHREASAPVHEEGFRSMVPIHDRVWWQGATIVRGAAPVQLRDVVSAYLAQNANAFEYEYVRLGQAWLKCLDGAVADGRKVLEELDRDLPEGNVARGTARTLLKQLDAGEPLSKRLEFLPDE